MGVFRPSLVTAKSVIPRSTPTARPTDGSGSGILVSTAKVIYQRPSGSRDTTTIVGSRAVVSTFGHDHTNRSGPLVLAKRSTPPCMVNADRVLCADWWPCRDLNRG